VGWRSSVTQLWTRITPFPGQVGRLPFDKPPLGTIFHSKKQLHESKPSCANSRFLACLPDRVWESCLLWSWVVRPSPSKDSVGGTPNKPGGCLTTLVLDFLSSLLFHLRLHDFKTPTSKHLCFPRLVGHPWTQLTFIIFFFLIFWVLDNTQPDSVLCRPLSAWVLFCFVLFCYYSWLSPWSRLGRTTPQWVVEHLPGWRKCISKWQWCDGGLNKCCPYLPTSPGARKAERCLITGLQGHWEEAWSWIKEEVTEIQSRLYGLGCVSRTSWDVHRHSIPRTWDKAETSWQSFIWVGQQKPTGCKAGWEGLVQVWMSGDTNSLKRFKTDGLACSLHQRPLARWVLQQWCMNLGELRPWGGGWRWISIRLDLPCDQETL
jgi:hypothetical protein